MEGHFSRLVFPWVTLLYSRAINISVSVHEDSSVPTDMFVTGAVYSLVMWFWLIGALLPVALYFLIRAFPRSKLR